MRQCPYCAENISDYVIKCRHCNTWLTDNPPEFWTPEDKAPEPDTMQVHTPPSEPEITIIPGGGDTLPAVMIIPDEQPATVSPRLGR